MKYQVSDKEVMFLFVDLQERLMIAMEGASGVVKNVNVLMKLSKIIDAPAIITTQYKHGLGDTIDKLDTNNFLSIDKTEFSCFSNEEIKSKIISSNKKKIVISGVEAHICVYQTARDLIQNGYEVYVVEDAVTSRKINNKYNALMSLRDMGAVITNTETFLFDIIKDAKSPYFKEAQSLVK